MNSRVLGWCLYDFAASALMANGGLYFMRWLVLERGLPNTAFNATISGVALVVLATASVVGSRIDRGGSPTSILRACALVMFAATLGIFLLSQSQIELHQQRLLALVAFAVLYIANQWGLVAYNSLLVTFEDPKAVSGYGTAFNWLGALFGLAATYPFVQQSLSGSNSSAAAFLPAGIIFAVFSLLALLLLGKKASVPSKSPEVRPMRVALTTALKNKGTVPILLALLFFVDGVLTIQFNASAYLGQVFAIPRESIVVPFLVLFCGIASGGLGYAVLWRRKRPVSVFRWSVLLLSVTIYCLATISQRDYVNPIFAAAGFLVGLSLASIRAAFAVHAPRHTVGILFGIYTTVERAGSIIGPMIWSTLTILGSQPENSAPQARTAMTGMAVLVFMSFLTLLAHREPQHVSDARGRLVQEKQRDSIE